MVGINMDGSLNAKLVEISSPSVRSGARNCQYNWFGQQQQLTDIDVEYLVKIHMIRSGILAHRYQDSQDQYSHICDNWISWTSF